MQWGFSKIDPDPPRRGVNTNVEIRHERIGNEIHAYLNTSIEVFLLDYREHLPEPPQLGDDAFHNLERLLAAIRQTPYRLYLLIDEYDNFANEVMTADAEAYHDLVHGEGPFKYLFKWVKSVMAGAGLDRLFITGVSPVVMSDVTSGMNIAKNIYLEPEVSSLCGFVSHEVRDLLERLHAEKAEQPWTVPDALIMLRDWYNGYRFAVETQEAVYNPTLVLYFLERLQRTGKYPRQMLDSNLATDDGKLDYIAQMATGQDAVINLIRQEQPLEIRQLRDRFKLREMLEVTSQDTSFLGSFLFYFGMLTLREEETPEQTLELVIPNEVVRGLYIERVRTFLMPLGASRTAADTILFAFLRSGDLVSLLDFIEETLFPTFSNRDARWANELTIKTLFLTLLWNDVSYVTHSEPELDHRYADLCLLRRTDARGSSLWDLLFEFKWLSLKELGMSGQESKEMSRKELIETELVKAALDEAEIQLNAYHAALEHREGGALKLRSYAVVALGFERLVHRTRGS